MTEQTTSKGKGYNLTVKQLTAAEHSTTASGTAQIKFRGSLTLHGETRERTVVAQGKAAEAISAMVGEGNELSLRCLFERAPANEEGKRGGEFLTVLGIPLPPKAKAA